MPAGASIINHNKYTLLIDRLVQRIDPLTTVLESPVISTIPIGHERVLGGDNKERILALLTGISQKIELRRIQLP